MKTIEKLVLKNLLQNEQYVRKVLPYLNDGLFDEKLDKILFTGVKDYILKYNARPSQEAVGILLQNNPVLDAEELAAAAGIVTDLAADSEVSDPVWLLSETEKFVKEKTLHNAILDSIYILDGKDKNRNAGMIPKLVSDALAVSFDPNIGHDYIVNADQRYEFYHRVEEKMPFDLEMFNKITKGGLPKKSLTVILAGTGVGKSLTMCHMSAAALAQNKNVLYITMEMSEERTAQRIDANLLNVDINTLENLSKEEYDRKIRKLKENIKGKLIIKEYPTAAAGYSNFKALLNELWLKKKFKPDIIFVDYINICNSSRIKPGNGVNSYTLIKSIAEELRGLAVEFDVPLVTATQLTRTGFDSSDPDMTDTAESFGLPATADLMFVIISNEELDGMNQLSVKQLKNRYNDPTINKRFPIGVDRAKMRLFDVDENQQARIQSDKNDRANVRTGQRLAANTDASPPNDVSETIRQMMGESRSKFNTAGIKV